MDNKKRIIRENLNKLIGEKFGNYSKYIIQERALPDLRDGLKPVQRRILFSMNDLKLSHNSPYKKSARVVGDVIGKYHPHGDTSVYEAMVRMSQEWKMNIPLVDMHGNKGSIDGDSAAAMRYTEARLSSIASFMLANIKKNIVSFAPNFDDSEMEPTVLPTIYPNLLVNGSMGIASGYSTNLPPHNLSEVLKALTYVLQNEDYTLSNILRFIKGPDFPTGGQIIGKDEIKKMYREGKGKIIIRSKYEFNQKENEIIITEIPFESNKSDIVKRIDDLINQGKIPSVLYVRDDSDRKGLSITIKLKPKVQHELIMNYLFKSTDLQKNYNANFVAIRNKKPELLSLLDIFESFKEFQIKIYRNLYKFELEKLRKRMEIVEALMIIIDVIDEVIKIIRSSLNKTDARNRIMQRFNFNENQGEAIVSLRLYRLTSTDINELREEHKQLKEMISHYEKALNDKGYLIIQIVNGLEELKTTFNEKRRTEIVDENEQIEVKEEDLIEEEKIYLGVSRDGYLKKVSVRSKESSNEDDYGLREGDFDIMIEKVSNLNNIFFFTTNGRYYSIPIYKLKQSKWKDVGEHASNYTSISGNEKILRVVIGKEIKRGKYLVVSTKNGMIKRTNISDLVVPSTKSGAKYINLKDDDKVVSVSFMKLDKSHIVSATSFGFIIRYDANLIPITGNTSGGVKNITLIEKDQVIKTLVFDENDVEEGKEQISFITTKGKMKRIRVSEIKLTSRALKGMRILKEVKSYKEYLMNMFDAYRVKMIKILTDKNKYMVEDPKRSVLLSDSNSGFSHPFKVNIVGVYEAILADDIEIEFTTEQHIDSNKLFELKDFSNSSVINENKLSNKEMNVEKNKKSKEIDDILKQLDLDDLLK